MFLADTISLNGEVIGGDPLLVPVMRNGQRTAVGNEPLDAARERAAGQLERLPHPLRRLEPADPPYPVGISEHLRQERQHVIARLHQSHVLDGS